MKSRRMVKCLPFIVLSTLSWNAFANAVDEPLICYVRGDDSKLIKLKAYVSEYGGNRVPYLIHGTVSKGHGLADEEMFFFDIVKPNYDQIWQVCHSEVSSTQKLVGVSALVANEWYAPITDSDSIVEFMHREDTEVTLPLRNSVILQQLTPATSDAQQSKTVSEYLETEQKSDFGIKVGNKPPVSINSLVKLSQENDLKQTNGYAQVSKAVREYLVGRKIGKTAAEAAADFIVRYNNANALAGIGQKLLADSLLINSLAEPKTSVGNYTVVNVNNASVTVIFNYQAKYETFQPAGLNLYSPLEFTIMFEIPFTINIKDYKPDLLKQKLWVIVPHGLFSKIEVSADSTANAITLSNLVKQFIFNQTALEAPRQNVDRWSY